MANRAYAQREWRLLSYWLAHKHPNADISMNVRIGPPVERGSAPSDSEPLPAVSRVFHRYADALFIESGEPYLVEAKMKPDPGIFSQLIHYARKFRADPNYRWLASRPLRLIALVYSDDPSVAEEAPFYRVRWEVYQPELNDFAPPQVRLPGLENTSGQLELPSDWVSRLQSWGIVAASEKGDASFSVP